MAVFGVRLPAEQKTEKFIEETRNRFAGDNIIKNPFRADIRQFGNVYIFKMDPVYPNVTWVGWMGAFATFFFAGWTYWLIPSILIGCLGFFFTGRFFYQIFSVSCKKKGIKCGRMLKGSSLVKEVFFNGSKKSI